MTRKPAIHVALCVASSLAVACHRGSEAPKPEPVTLNVTHWTDKTELYMEYPPLVGGQSALFAVHLTTLSDFRALAAGTPSLEFRPEGGGASVSLRGSPPSRPGAFRIEGAPPSPGKYRWALLVNAPSATDRHELGEVTVYRDVATAEAVAGKRPPEDPAAIAYLKEQQWTNAFATVRVEAADLRASIKVPASIEPLSGGEALVTAPAAGRFVATSLVAIGTTVRAGQELGRLEPRLTAGEDRATLAAEVSQAQLAVESARAEQARAERLLTDRAVPARRVEDAHRAVTAAEARLRAAEARLAQRDETLRSGGGAAAGNAFTIRAPIAGRVADVLATLGASYHEGSPLFRIVRTDRVELRAHVPAADVPIARGLSEVAFQVPGQPDPIPLRSEHVHDAGVLDTKTGALPIQFEVENPGGQLLVGQNGTAILFGHNRVRTPTVPKAAVLFEAGRPYVFVQTGGERFARRYVDIAVTDGNQVGLRNGVAIGERVVTKGAYEVQLASAAKGLPAEGHVH
jgi:membrane fusion protein, heavy metal efflux system